MSSNHNQGHGHVWERPDGMKARCGGPGLCRECTYDDMRLREVRSTMPWSEIDITLLLRAKDKAAEWQGAHERLRRAVESEAFLLELIGNAQG